MEHNDLIQIKAALQEQKKLLEKILTVSEKANEMIFLLLSVYEKKALRSADVQKLIKSVNRPRQP